MCMYVRAADHYRPLTIAVVTLTMVMMMAGSRKMKEKWRHTGHYLGVVATRNSKIPARALPPVAAVARTYLPILRHARNTGAFIAGALEPITDV